MTSREDDSLFSTAEITLLSRERGCREERGRGASHTPARSADPDPGHAGTLGGPRSPPGWDAQGTDGDPVFHGAGKRNCLPG